MKVLYQTVSPLPLFLFPSYRYALVCQQCFSHNGMALKEEFEYLGKNTEHTAAFNEK